MSNKIIIELTDQDCHDIITTALEGPCMMVWCKRAEQSESQSDRYTLTLTADGTDEWHKCAEGLAHRRSTFDVVQVDIIPNLIRQAIGEMLAPGQPIGHRKIAAATLVDIGNVDHPSADAIVQQAIFGRVVFG